MADEYDFSGIATAYNVPCTDGRVIDEGAFNHQDGETIPLVWRHRHLTHEQMITNIVGSARLSVSEEPAGMRVKAVLLKTKEGKQAKALVHGKTVKNLSIWANELKQEKDGSFLRVKGGTIREVSLVLNGANPGAVIEEVLVHSDDPLDGDLYKEDGIIIHTDFEIELVEEEEPEAEEDTVTHGDSKTIAEVLSGLSDDQKKVFDYFLQSAAQGETNPQSGSENGDGPTIQEVFDTLSEEQKTVLYYMAGNLSQEDTLSQGDDNMPASTHNVFEGNESNEAVLAHEALNNILDTARKGRMESLRNLVKADEMLQHSITDVSNLFPDARPVDAGGPMLYSREMSWVDKVLGACRRRPFARIRSWYADITADEARAKGYVTGNQKVEEVIAVLKRTTTPQTIYKLQKLDRDDVVDITDFNVIIWLKNEMRLMLREELARAILIGDGRSGVDDDKIVETNVRPIATDDAVYQTDRIFLDAGSEVDVVDLTAAQVLAVIDYIADSRQYYKGSGSPTFYCTTEILTKMLLVRDANDHRLHKTEAELASALRVSQIVEVPVMSAQVESAVDIGGTNYEVETMGVIVNLDDYVIGADKGGETNFFDDFDLNYNKLEYLLETRVSGALVKPKSALTMRIAIAVSV